MIDVVDYLNKVYFGVAVAWSYRYDPVGTGTNYISVHFSKYDGTSGRYVVFYVHDDHVEFSLDLARFYFSSPLFFEDLCGHIDLIRLNLDGVSCVISDD